MFNDVNVHVDGRNVRGGNEPHDIAELSMIQRCIDGVAQTRSFEHDCGNTRLCVTVSCK